MLPTTTSAIRPAPQPRRGGGVSVDPVVGVVVTRVPSECAVGRVSHSRDRYADSPMRVGDAPDVDVTPAGGSGGRKEV